MFPVTAILIGFAQRGAHFECSQSCQLSVCTHAVPIVRGVLTTGEDGSTQLLRLATAALHVIYQGIYQLAARLLLKVHTHMSLQSWSRWSSAPPGQCLGQTPCSRGARPGSAAAHTAARPRSSAPARHMLHTRAPIPSLKFKLTFSPSPSSPIWQRYTSMFPKPRPKM